jgi:predicted alpha/beta-fold hydrolase
VQIPTSVTIWQTKHGGHMGFIACNAKGHDYYYWLDQLLIKWLDNDFKSDLLI